MIKTDNKEKRKKERKKETSEKEKRKSVFFDIEEFDLNLYKIFISKILKAFNIPYNVANLPIKTKKLTLLKAPHVYKAAREQFIIKNYKTLIILKSTIDLNRLKLLILNKPKTVKINVKKIGE